MRGFYCNRPFLVPTDFCIKTRLSAQPLIWRWFFILMQIKLIFTRKVVHLASFWKWGFWNSAEVAFCCCYTIEYKATLSGGCKSTFYRGRVVQTFWNSNELYYRANLYQKPCLYFAESWHSRCIISQEVIYLMKLTVRYLKRGTRKKIIQSQRFLETKDSQVFCMPTDKIQVSTKNRWKL